MERKCESVLMALALLLSGCISGPPDLDGDGISDDEDMDVDGDGWDDETEMNCSTDWLLSSSWPSDLDNDGECDILDNDDDNDGWSDSTEMDCSADPMDNSSTPEDNEGDRICDLLDNDADGDGLPNDWEQERGFDYLNSEDYMSCHGMSIYCMRSYDDFTFPETHNSYSSVEDQIIVGTNHYTGLHAQWDGGIRAFMLDPHHKSEDDTSATDVRFCHGTGQFFHACQFGEVDAFAWLRELGSLLNNSSGDVVSLLIENYYTPAEHLEFLFNETGILDRAYIHSLGDPWPSIGDMSLMGKDVVIFVQLEHNDSYPFFNAAWKHSWDTPYGQRDAGDMTCELGRGDYNQPVWHLSNWLSSTFGLADPSGASEVNDYDTLLNRTLDCWEQNVNRPTFIAVDYWEEGELTNVTITLNKMSHWSDDIPPHP